MFEKKYTLLHVQKKRVYDILQGAGLEPADFSWSQVTIAEQFIVSRLSYRRGDQYYFQFASLELNSWCIACPGQHRSVDYEYPRSWEEQVGIVCQWAETLKGELETPDPWAELAKYRLLITGEPSEDVVNEPIASAEAEQIGQALVQLAGRVTRDFSLGDDQIAWVRARLEYLADAARRERSRDWVYTVIGVWTSIAAALALTEEQAATLWRMLKCELGSFVNLLLDRALNPTSPMPTAEITSGAPAPHPEQTRKRS